MNVHREPRHALGLSLLSVAFLIGAASPAAAHDGEGILTVESQIPTGDVVVEYVVRVTWADDGHPALQSTVTATPIASDGAPQTPVSLDPIDEDGRYAGTVTYPAPGDWTVRFTSVTPTGSVEIVEPIRSQPTTTTAPATTTVPREPGDDDPGSDATTGEESNPDAGGGPPTGGGRSEEHTSELQSLLRTSY